MVGSSMSKLILAFVTLIIGLVLIGSVATEGQAKTTYKSVANEVESYLVYGNAPNVTEVHTVTNAPTGWKVQDCPISSVAIKNASGGTALTDDTDYTLTESSGTWVFINSTATRALVSMAGSPNTTYADYKYCGDDYMNLTWGRTGINLVPGFFAIALLLISVGLFYSVAKDEGVI